MGAILAHVRQRLGSGPGRVEPRADVGAPAAAGVSRHRGVRRVHSPHDDNGGRVSPRGRRPAGADARGDILAAARRAFAERGYDSASIRAIAREADVDPALVHHYFDGKSDLFFHAIIGDIENASEPRIRPANIIESVIAGPEDTLAERWTIAVLELWDRPGAGDRLVSMLGAMAAGDEVRRPVQEFLEREVFTPIIQAFPIDRPVLRAQLCAAHVIGLAVARYVARLPLLAELSPQEVAALTAPNLQRYLTGDLGTLGSGPRSDVDRG